MAYKGHVRAGSIIEAELRLDHTAGAEAFVFIAAASSGGPTASDDAVLAPGGACTVSVTPVGRGRLEISVDMARNADSGRLIVREDGAVRDDESLRGDSVWAYSVHRAKVDP